MVSVIMPAYNSGKTISSSMESVVGQSYENWELLIYDDASCDNTLEKVYEYNKEDKRIKIFEGKKNKGVSFARNRLLQEASGRYIAFLDSDDRWKSDKLEKQLSFMEQTGCGFCYSGFELMDETGKISGKTMDIPGKKADYKALLKNNFIGMLTIVIDTELTGKISFSSKRHEDLILWLSLARKDVQMLGIGETLAYYRISGKSLSGNKLKSAVWRWKVYYSTENLGIFKSLYYMSIYICNSILKRI